MSARGSVLLVDDATKILTALASAVRADGHVSIEALRIDGQLLGR